MIFTREMFLMIILAGFGIGIFFLLQDNDIVMGAIAAAGLIYVIRFMWKDKLIMEGV